MMPDRVSRAYTPQGRQNHDDIFKKPAIKVGDKVYVKSHSQEGVVTAVGFCRYQVDIRMWAGILSLTTPLDDLTLLPEQPEQASHTPAREAPARP